MNFICREDVLQVLETFEVEQDARDAVEALFSYPAPNPDWKNNDRNIMGQTEDEFWDAVERQG